VCHRAQGLADDHDADRQAEDGGEHDVMPTPRLQHPVLDGPPRKLMGSQRLDGRQFARDGVPHLFRRMARSAAHQDVGDPRGRGSAGRSAPPDLSDVKMKGARREGADFRGKPTNDGPVVQQFHLVAQPADAQLPLVQFIDHDRVRAVNGLEVAGLHAPRAADGALVQPNHPTWTRRPSGAPGVPADEQPSAQARPARLRTGKYGARDRGS